MKNEIWNHRKCYDKTRKECMHTVLSTAEKLIVEAKTYEQAPIFDLIRLLTLNILTEHDLDLLYTNSLNIPALKPMTPNGVFPLRGNTIIHGQFLRDYFVKKELPDTFEIILASDPVIPDIWKVNRLIDCEVHVGNNRNLQQANSGKWTANSNSHQIILWFPIGVSWTGFNGNHSINAGILQSQGVIPAKCIEAYDFAKLYDYVLCDGMYYWNIESHKRICKVTNFEFAVIYEIGRLLLKHGVYFKEQRLFSN